MLHSYHVVHIVFMSVTGALRYESPDRVWTRYFISNMLRYESPDTNYETYCNHKNELLRPN